MINIYNKIKTWVFSVLAIILIWAIIALALKSKIPSSNNTFSNNASSYPPPDVLLTPTLSSQEAVCDKVWGFRHDMTGDIKATYDKEYQDCVDVYNNKANVHTQITKPLSTLAQLTKYPKPFFERPAGTGTILEGSSSAFGSFYFILNSWSGEINGIEIKVFAGALTSDVPSGPYKPPEEWTGVLLISPHDASGNSLPSIAGTYPSPGDSGILRIVDVEGTTLTLVAKNGEVLTFDVINHEYSIANSASILKRTTMMGDIIENKVYLFSIDGYIFENYLIAHKENGNVLWVLAGTQSENLNQGVIVVVETSRDVNTILEKTVYFTPFLDGTLRIVDARDNDIYWATDYGTLYRFNIDSRTFIRNISSGLYKTFQSETIDSGITTSMLASDEIISGILGFTATPTPTPTPTSSSGGFPTRTPTLTPTGPTRTPTKTLTPTRTNTPTKTLTPTRTNTPTLTPSKTPTITFLPTYSPPTYDPYP